MTMEEILTSGLAELGVPATAAQLSQRRAYYTLLDERSKVMNLTAIEGEEATVKAIFGGEIRKGDIVVILYEGPKALRSSSCSRSSALK